jgi:hypothetical protein
VSTPQENRLLDEKGFEFYDDHDRLYLVRLWGGDPWLFYKHPDGQWVSLRKVTQAEVFQMDAARERGTGQYHG